MCNSYQSKLFKYMYDPGRYCPTRGTVSVKIAHHLLCTWFTDIPVSTRKEGVSTRTAQADAALQFCRSSLLKDLGMLSLLELGQFCHSSILHEPGLLSLLLELGEQQLLLQHLQPQLVRLLAFRSTSRLVQGTLPLQSVRNGYIAEV